MKREIVEGTPDTFLEEAETMEFSSKLGSRSLGRDTPTTMAASALSYKPSLKGQLLCLPLLWAKLCEGSAPFQMVFFLSTVMRV